MTDVEVTGFTDRQLEEFRRWQRTSYAVLEEVAGQLTEGTTERDATRLAMKAYRREGADRFFHLPVALFGERTALPEPWTTESFWPTDRALAPGDSFVLDASAMFSGYLVDTSMSGCLGTNPAHTEAMADDLAHRDEILAAVQAGATFREIARQVDGAMQARGDRNCHQLHPEAVLGHRVLRFPTPGDVPPPDGSGFDTTVLRWFVEGIAAARTVGTPSPTWSDQAISDHLPAPGLWAVEPHLGRGAIGVKWEELLVITDGDAHWLDDQAPHLRT
jgi:Xaa-Pro aminopeptidase